MNDCILVQARTGSQRLKNKILLKIQGKTILEILISRLKKCKKIHNLIIVTTKLIFSEVLRITLLIDIINVQNILK